MIERGALCFQQIVEDGACRADGRGVPLGETKALQTGRLEELGQMAVGGVVGKRPRGATRDHAGAGHVVRQRRRVVREQTFAGPNAHEFVGQLPRRKAGGKETTCGEFCPGDPDLRCVGRRPRHAVGDRGEEITLARIEQRLVGQRARRDDARDLALHQSLGELRVFDLLTHRGPIAGGDDLPQIAVQLVVRKSRHGNRILTFVTAGQRQSQFARRGLRVIVEELVEIPHPEQQQRIATGRLGVLVLLHHRRRSHAFSRSVART